MAEKGKPNFLQAMAVLRHKKIRGLTPTGGSPRDRGGKSGKSEKFHKKIFGSSKNLDSKGGKKL